MNVTVRFLTLTVVCCTAALLVLLNPLPAVGQHPVEVQRLSANEQHFDALALYNKLPNRRSTTEALLAAARSAWALSLPKAAADYFDSALHDDNLNSRQQARIQLSRGIIEFQEERYQVAILYANKAVSILSMPSALRARAWMLWAESLLQLRSFAAAEQKYQLALQESPDHERIDIHFSHGLALYELGDLDAAVVELKKVPLSHLRAPQCIRLLAQIALEQDRSSDAAFWLKTGRDRFANDFLDSWVDYSLVKIAIEQDNASLVNRVLQHAEKKYPPSDGWLVLAQASAEAYYWNRYSQERR